MFKKVPLLQLRAFGKRVRADADCMYIAWHDMERLPLISSELTAETWNKDRCSWTFSNRSSAR